MTSSSGRVGVGRALWNKDRPWVLIVALGGLIALVAAIGDGGFAYDLAFESGRHDAEFHTMWICGLVLGFVAATFERVLGVSEFLRQRPVDDAQIFYARLRAIGVVIAIWLVGAPIVAWFGMLAFESMVGFSFAAVLGLWTSCVVVFSATAIGLFAGMLPAPWWLRLAAGAGLLLTMFSAIYQLARLESGYHNVTVTVGLHLGVAAVLVLLAYGLRSRISDPDHPSPARTRLVAGSVSILAVAIVVTAGIAESERTACYWLQSAYPGPVVHDGQVKLIDRDSRFRARGGVVFVDANHAPTGETAERKDIEDFHRVWRWHRPDRNWLGFDAPWWHRGLQVEWIEDQQVILGWNGAAWIRPLNSSRSALRPTGKGPELARFEGRAGLYSSRRQDSWMFVFEESTQSVHQFDLERGYFVPLAMPGGDRVTRINYMRPLPGFLGNEGEDHVLTFEGEQGNYTLRDGALIDVPIEKRVKATKARRAEATISGGPIVATIDVAASGNRPAFSHEFRPRRFAEYAYAGAALTLAVVQPPVTNLFGRSAGTSLLSLAVGILCAALAGRRLRRIGAARHVRQYWVVLCVLIGPVALPLCIALERPRAHRERILAVVEPPRIFTPLTSLEAVR